VSASSFIIGDVCRRCIVFHENIFRAFYDDNVQHVTYDDNKNKKNFNFITRKYSISKTSTIWSYYVTYVHLGVTRAENKVCVEFEVLFEEVSRILRSITHTLPRFKNDAKAVIDGIICPPPPGPPIISFKFKWPTARVYWISQLLCVGIFETILRLYLYLG